jgi:hypothetical protein
MAAALDGDVTDVGPDQSGHHEQERGLARTGRAYDRHDLALSTEVDGVQYGSVGFEPECDVVQPAPDIRLGRAQLPARVGKNRLAEDVLDAAEPGK